MAKDEVLKKAQGRGFQDAQDGYQGPDMADVADLITEATTDEMPADKYNEIAQEVADAYSKGYGEGRKKN